MLDEFKNCSSFYYFQSSTNITSLVDIKGHASVHSVAVQLRAMSYDGFAPERSHITALSDDGCRAPFRFNDQILLPNVKRSKESFAGEYERTSRVVWFLLTNLPPTLYTCNTVGGGMVTMSSVSFKYLIVTPEEQKQKCVQILYP